MTARPRLHSGLLRRSLRSAGVAGVVAAVAVLAPLASTGAAATAPSALAAEIHVGADVVGLSDRSLPMAAGSSIPGAPTSAAATPALATSSLAPVPTVIRPSWQAPGARNTLRSFRLAGYCGYPGIAGQGRLGIGKLADRTAEIAKLARGYRVAGGKATIPVLELIAVTVQGRPGPDRMWRTRTPDAVIAAHLAAARSINAMLVLNIQPGQSDFLTETKALAKWLVYPDVTVALDPEWRMHPGQVPMRQFGWVSASEVNATGSYLSALVRTNKLAEKVVIVHQLNRSVVRTSAGIAAYDGVSWVQGVDGIGSRAAKTATYVQLTAGAKAYLHPGFKVFFIEDRHYGPVMTIAQVMALAPRPDYVMYE